MKFQGAVIKEQGVTFGIVVVKSTILQSPSGRDEMSNFGVQAFGSMPIVLMAQNARGVPTYWGRTDIVSFLSHISMHRIPWKEYTLVA